MDICTFKASTQTTPEALWQLWTQVKHWPSWDLDLQSAAMHGTFKQGATGTLIQMDGTERTFSVIKVQMLESLVISVPYLHSTALLIRRDMQREGPMLHFEQDVSLSGAFLTKMLLRGHKDALKMTAAAQMQGVLNLLEGDTARSKWEPHQGSPITAR